MCSFDNVITVTTLLSSTEDTGEVDEHFANFALLEDIALRGFSPVLSYQESLLYSSSLNLTKSKQVSWSTYYILYPYNYLY